MIDSANPSSVTVHPLARAGSKPRRRWLLALLLPGLILVASPEPVMATHVNNGAPIEYGLIAGLIRLLLVTTHDRFLQTRDMPISNKGLTIEEIPKVPQNMNFTVINAAAGGAAPER
jgi:hypothetical protein